MISVRTLPDAAAIPGTRKALVLCGADGKMLPGQFGLTLEQKVGEPTLVTVSFRVDGRTLVLDLDKAPGE